MKKVNLTNFTAVAQRARRYYHSNYFAMYSGFYDCIITEPVLMSVPVDDHLVHRGDGVFETFRCVDGSIYNMWAHLDRLQYAAGVLSIDMPCTTEKIAHITTQTVRAGEHRDCTIRVLVSRGPGSLGVSPYDSPESKLYVVAAVSSEPFMKVKPAGAVVRTSAIPPKDPFFAGVKNCNYLQNVLMKKETVDAGVDFTVAFDQKGFMAEGATANVGIVTAKAQLLFPKTERTLCGTTMMRVMELAKGLVAKGKLTDVAFADIPRQEVLSAVELLITGTSIDVTSGVEFNGVRIGDGKPGPVSRELDALLQDDMQSNNDLLTPAFS